MAEKISSFDEFWHFYLAQHAHAKNRFLHFFGTTLAIILGGISLITGNILLTALALPVGYCFSWVGHFVYEKNKPASFKYPIWSLKAEIKMYGLFLKRLVSSN